MDLGSFTLAWAFVPLVLSMAGYLLVAVGMREYRLSARVVYWLLFAMVAVAFIDLFRLFMTDRFQFSYVASYSSSDLSNSWPHFFKMSALWAGQQGTFLLWLVFGLVLGFWVKSRAGENEGWVMFFYIVGLTFLLVLAAVSNPFKKLDFIPPDGQGLNPLLQNYWMQIHPPIVFMGFASACIPFAFAMASLATNRYEDWVKKTMPWVVFTVVTLGLGIFLGGYWAYETLGWGGYWAWDPVENSSLIPWLASIALVHGMVVEKSRGTWRRTNLFLAITMFLLVVYGTFLTRSGVLADFSVHSFVDLGYNNILWASIAVLGVVSYGLWGYRSSKMKVPAQKGTPILSQEFTTYIAMVLLLPFTFLVLFWTSFPLVTTLIGKIPLLSGLAPAPAAVQQENYNIAGIIFAIIFATILGLNALLGWSDTDKGVFKRKLLSPLVISLVVSILFIILGYPKIHEFWTSEGRGGTGTVIIMATLYFLFFSTAFFSLVSNFIFMIRRFRTKFLTGGGYLTHFGFSLLLIGVIFSSGFGDSQKVAIPEGGSRAALGYDIAFTGTESLKSGDELTKFRLSKGNSTINAASVAKEMRRGDQIQYARTPYIEKFLFHDLYLSTENVTEPGHQPNIPFTLKKGESTTLAGMNLRFDGFDSDLNAQRLASSQGKLFELGKGQTVTINGASVKFTDFNMTHHQEGTGTGIGANLRIDYMGEASTIVPMYVPSLPSQEPVAFPSGGYISLTKIRADKGTISLGYSRDKSKPDLEVGTILTVTQGADTTEITPTFNASGGQSRNAIVDLPDGGRMMISDIMASSNTAEFVYSPPHMPRVASIAISTKPLINLVWFGFIMIVGGAVIAVFRRMTEGKRRA